MSRVPERSGAPEASRVLVLAPIGRDAGAVQGLLGREGIDCQVCLTLETLASAISEDSSAVLIADEVFAHADLSSLATKIAVQPPWSDLPFIGLTRSGPTARRIIAELHLQRRSGM